MLDFSKTDVDHTHLWQHFWLNLDIFMFSLIKSLSWNNTLKCSVCKLCALIGCHCTKVHTKCAKLVDENFYRLFCCPSVRDFEPKILVKCVHLTNFEKLFDRKFSYEEWYTYCMSKKSKKSTCLLLLVKLLLFYI